MMKNDWSQQMAASVGRLKNIKEKPYLIWDDFNSFVVT